jgi:hypothetical protein
VVQETPTTNELVLFFVATACENVAPHQKNVNMKCNGAHGLQ